jgi:hypothetical protein
MNSFAAINVTNASQRISEVEALWDCVANAESPDDIVKIAQFIRSGADVTERHEGGKTILYETCCPEVLGALLCLPGIDINNQDDESNTVLHHMAFCFMNCLDASYIRFRKEIKMLLSSGANPCLENNDGKVARQILEGWQVEEEALPINERTRDSEKLLKACREMIQELRAAEEDWIATHGERAVRQNKGMIKNNSESF